jgi:DMSO/TMAO reductase YedYZ molybdopterin-dependent catalytic subunit
MDEPIISRGFFGRRRGAASPGRVPPGQYVTTDFPVLSAGPTPRVPPEAWSFEVRGAVGRPRRWSREEFLSLPRSEIVVDIHCVTKWSKLDTRWSGVSLDVLLEDVDPQGAFVTAACDGGYTTNLPLADVVGGRAWVVDTYEGAPLAPEHGGPARLLVPHLYFWKSAKWVRALEVTLEDRPGFWEEAGYHDRGDPWQEQRYQGD